MQEQEEWRPAVGYEGILEVSNLGRVKRLAFTTEGGHWRCEKIVEPTSASGGYLSVGVRDASRKWKAPRVHALVAEAFLGPRPKDKVINHIDFNKANNCVSNLEYVTHRENVHHSARAARHSGMLTMEEVQALRSLVKRDPGIDLDMIAKRMDIPLNVVFSVLDARTYFLVPNKDGTLPEPLLYTHCKTICLEDIQDLQALGFSLSAISMFYGVNYSTPYQMLRRAGIHQNNKYSNPGTGRRMSKERAK